MVPSHQRIAIISFDSTALSEAHLKAAWPQQHGEKLIKVGIEGTQAWRLINRPDAVYDWDLIGVTLDQLCARSLHSEDIGAVIVECCAFSPFVPRIQDRLRRPTFDIISAARALLPEL
jgi:hypothetical protein